VIVKVMLLVDTHIVNKSMRSINGKTIESKCQDIGINPRLQRRSCGVLEIGQSEDA
jgi:hypothetical protein